MQNLYVQGTAFHGAVKVSVEKMPQIIGRNPSFDLERVQITVTAKIGEILVDHVITVFSEDREKLELEIIED